jgi:hypothetical protein
VDCFVSTWWAGKRPLIFGVLFQGNRPVMLFMDLAEIELQVGSAGLGRADERREGGGAFSSPLDPAKRFFFPNATTPKALSAASLSISTSSSLRYRVSAGHLESA